jgi:hypothetical protein
MNKPRISLRDASGASCMQHGQTQATISAISARYALLP